MRRMFMLVGLSLVLLVVAAGVALAVVKTCNNVPCNGTDDDDVMYERIGNHEKDRIYGYDGRDDIDANTYRRDDDKVFGGPKGDRLLTNDNDGKDAARGGDGSDKCIVDPGDVRRSCEDVNVEAAGLAAGVETNQTAKDFGVSNTTP